jgi:hypothetical protein
LSSFIFLFIVLRKKLFEPGKSVIRSPSKDPFCVFPYILKICLNLNSKYLTFKNSTGAFESPFSKKKIQKILVILLYICTTSPRQDCRNQESVFRKFLQFFFYKNMAKAYKNRGIKVPDNFIPGVLARGSFHFPWTLSCLDTFGSELRRMYIYQSICR